MAIPPDIRFWNKVDKTPTCWLWTGTTSGSCARYGYFRPGTRSTDPKMPAHRYSYELAYGPIPPGMEIDHVVARGCTSKLCVRPDHLEVVAHAENRKRGRLSTCRAGLHDLNDPKNQRWDSNGHRRGCNQCWLDRAADRRSGSHRM